MAAARGRPRCSATTPRSSGRSTVDEPRRAPLRAPVRPPRPPDPATGDHVRVVADFVTVDDGSGIVHLAPAFGEVDREVARARGPPRAQPGRRRRPASTARVRAVRRALRQGRRRRHHRRPGRGRAARARRRLHALVPPLLALRHPADLLGQAHVVRAHVVTAATTCCARTTRSAGTPSTSSTAASATGSRTTSTGPCRATASGARPSRSGAAATAATTTCVGSVAELAELAGRDLLEASTSTGPTSTTSRSHCPRVRRCARAGSSPCSTRGSTRARCRRRSSTTRSSTTTSSTRRFPADFICEAIDQTRGWFYSLLAVNTLVFDDRRTATSCASRTSSTATARRCRSRKGNVIDPWTILDSRGADALRWYFFSAGSPVDAAAGCSSRASTSRPAGSC